MRPFFTKDGSKISARPNGTELPGPTPES